MRIDRLGCIDIDKKRIHYNILHRRLYNLKLRLVVPQEDPLVVTLVVKLVVKLVVTLVDPLVVTLVDQKEEVYNKDHLHLFLRNHNH
jgi:hypothetical protein